MPWTGSSPSPGLLIGLLVGRHRHGRRLADDAAPRAVLRLQAVDRDRDGHRPRRDLQVVRRRPAPPAWVTSTRAWRRGCCSARRRSRSSASRSRGGSGASTATGTRTRRRRSSASRSCVCGHRVPRQGVPPLEPRGQAVHPLEPRPGDRRRDGRRRRLRRRPHLGRERDDLRPRDADRVPADRREDRRHRHLPRRDPARRRRCGTSRRGARRPRGDRLAADRLRPRRPHRRPAHRQAPRPRAPDRARRDADAGRGQAHRSTRSRRDRAHRGRRGRARGARGGMALGRDAHRARAGPPRARAYSGSAGGIGQETNGRPVSRYPTLYAVQPAQKPVVAARSARAATRRPSAAPTVSSPNA